MQKKTKRIIILTILLLITISIILILTQTKNQQIPQPLTEQAKAEYTTQIGNQTYDITNVVLEPNEITPTISAGMIPVKWNGTNWEITTKENWYDYSNGKPAYIMLNDGYYKSEIEQGILDEQLMENNVGVGVPDDPNTLGTIYMWIPRFAYDTQGEILYIKQGCSVAGTYSIPEIFTYETEKRDFSLSGIWVEYSPLVNTSQLNTKVNNMNGQNNTYGFIANTQGTKASNETTYKTTIETYIKALTKDAETEEQWSPLQTQDNTNRSILKVTNTNQIEPIRGKAYYENTEGKGKIKIEVTYNTNEITKIIDKNGKELSTNSTAADTGEEPIGNKNYKFIIIDNQDNLKQVTVNVSGLDIYIIENEEDLKLFRDAVNAGNTKASTEAYQIANVYMNEGKYTIDEESNEVTFSSDAEKWIPIASYSNYSTKSIYKGKYYGQGYEISGIYIDTTNNYQGLFGYCENATIENLQVINYYIKSTGYNIRRSMWVSKK